MVSLVALDEVQPGPTPPTTWLSPTPARTPSQPSMRAHKRLPADFPISSTIPGPHIEEAVTVARMARRRRDHGRFQPARRPAIFSVPTASKILRASGHSDDCRPPGTHRRLQELEPLTQVSGGPKVGCGGVLLSHTDQGAVPSALVDLASGSEWTGRFPSAIAAANLFNIQTHQGFGCVVSRCIVDACFVVGQRIGVVVVSPRPISTSHLNTLLCVQFWPINPMVCGGLNPRGGEKPHLGTGFPLRCFQRLSLPNVANGGAPGGTNWHTRGSSVPVLSY